MRGRGRIGHLSESCLDMSYRYGGTGTPIRVMSGHTGMRGWGRIGHLVTEYIGFLY